MSLRITSISKRFGQTNALDAVSLELVSSQVTALIGENGAGKSTLIKILTGAYTADHGELSLNDAPLSLHGPHDARAAGIAVLHQEPHLVDALDGLENLYMGRRDFGGPGGVVSRRALRRRASALLTTYGIELPLDRLVRDMAPAQRTWLGLARCLIDTPGILILDEPTASLTADDTARLAAVIRSLRARGTAILFVSHRLDEVLSLADRIVVMRNGRVVAALDAAGQTHDALVALMSGVAAGPDEAPMEASAMEMERKQSTTATQRCRLAVDALSTRDQRVKRVTLNACAGEILGLYGLAGAGRTELLEAIFGSRALSGGTVTVDGAAMTSASPSLSLRRGLCLIPEDRKRHALMMKRSLIENLSLSRLHAFARFGVLDGRRERAAAKRAIDAHSIRAAGADQPVGELSGGNQQKAVFARALALSPGILLCDEPTQAVDVRTRRAIHALIRAHVDAGGTALVVTSDLDELVALADRVLVMRNGEIVHSVEQQPLSASDILNACFAPVVARAGSRDCTQ